MSTPILKTMVGIGSTF